MPLLAGRKANSKKERKDRQSRVEELEKELDKRKEAIGLDEQSTMRLSSRVATPTAVARRARALIWAHLLRVDVQDLELKSGELTMMPQRRRPR